MPRYQRSKDKDYDGFKKMKPKKKIKKKKGKRYPKKQSDYRKQSRKKKW